jgi:hypothetical protein
MDNQKQFYTHEIPPGPGWIPPPRKLVVPLTLGARLIYPTPVFEPYVGAGFGFCVGDTVAAQYFEVVEITVSKP